MFQCSIQPMQLLQKELCMEHFVVTTILLGILLSTARAKSSPATVSSDVTYCVSETGNCTSEPSLGCLATNCHPLTWYVNHTQDIPNNTKIIFLQGKHNLSDKLEFSNKKNLELLGAELNGNQVPSSEVVCVQKKESGLLFSFTSHIRIRRLAFKECGFHPNGTYVSNSAAISFISSFNVIISESNVMNSIGYNLLIETNCTGTFDIHDSVFTNGKCLYKKKRCENSGNFYVRFNRCSQNNSAPIKLTLNHSKFLYAHQNKHHPRLVGKGIKLFIYRPMVTVVIQNVVVNNSRANHGGNIQIYMYTFQKQSKLHFINCTIQNGYSHNGGGVNIAFINFHNASDLPYNNNATEALVTFKNTIFQGNHVNGTGGALYATFIGLYIPFLESQVRFFNCTFLNNLAQTGGALSFKQDKILSYSPLRIPRLSVSLKNCTFKENSLLHRGQLNGDGIVSFYSVGDVLIQNTKFLANNGTALLLIESSAVFRQNNTFQDNVALYGGAIRLCDVSVFFLTNGSQIEFERNEAHHAGGAIYAGGRCLKSSPQCFYQPFPGTMIEDLVNATSLRFSNNTARIAGDSIYGGSVDYCSTYDEKSGKFQVIDTAVYHEIFKVASSEHDSLSKVASDPYGVCLCDNHKPSCSKVKNLKTVFPGEEFTLLVAAVGQQDGIVPALIDLNKLKKYDHVNISLNKLANSPLPKKCQEISVTVFSRPHTTAEFDLVLNEWNKINERSNYYHIHPPRIKVDLLDCPWIFQFNNKTNSCDCNEVLRKHSTSKTPISCNITSLSLQKGKNTWVGYSENNSEVEISVECQSSNCKKDSSFTFTNSSLRNQCVRGKEGRVCGRCTTNYTLSLGISECIHSEENCSSFTTLLLVFAFVLAGVLLVCFLTVFNLTVAEGTVNGLLLYANCVHALVHFKYSEMKFFRVFISWLNLDLGFEVCFYSGMTAYQKIWLEFGFLFYLLLLGGLIICVSHKSVRFTRLVGRNVVPVLATIILIAYPKLIRNTLKVSQCSTVYSSTHQVHSLVWKADETVDCFSGKHLPLFIFSILLFAVAMLYSLCLFFIQCLQRGSGCFALRWINKLRPFFDASTGPCRDHHRFWPGLLLFARLFVYIAILLLPYPKQQLYVLIATCVMLFFLALVTPKGVYRKWPLNLLELWFIVNFGLASALLLDHRNHYEDIVANMSIGLATGTFFLMLVFHTYSQVRGTKRWKRLTTPCLDKVRRWRTDNKRNRTLLEVASEGEPLIQPEVLQPIRTEFTSPREPLLEDF